MFGFPSLSPVTQDSRHLPPYPQHTHPFASLLLDPGETGLPHHYRQGDWLYVKRHRQGSLEPCWKGLYVDC